MCISKKRVSNYYKEITVSSMKQNATREEFVAQPGVRYSTPLPPISKGGGDRQFPLGCGTLLHAVLKEWSTIIDERVWVEMDFQNQITFAALTPSGANKTR